MNFPPESLPNLYCVYFIGPVDTASVVKIGKTKFTDLNNRLGALQNACWLTLEIKAYSLVEGNEAAKHLEREMHSRFRSSRIRGEWFDLSPEMETEMKQLISGGGVTVDTVPTALRKQRPPVVKEAAQLPPRVTPAMVKVHCLALGLDVIRAGHPHGGFIVNNDNLWLKVPWQDQPIHYSWGEAAEWINNPSHTAYKHKQMLKVFGLLDANGNADADKISESQRLQAEWDEMDEFVDESEMAPQFIGNS